jgi:hypothetical protein
MGTARNTPDDDVGSAIKTSQEGELMRKRLSYANVAATMALVFSMSGGALAAKHYLLSSTKQISPKVLKSFAATNTKLFNKLAATATVAKANTANTAASAATAASATNAANATNATNAANANSATNAGHATNADNATAVGGMTAKKIYFKAPTGTGATTILDLDGLQFIASCIGGKAQLLAKTTVSDTSARVAFGTTIDEKMHTEGSSGFESGETIDAMAGTLRGTGTLVYMRPDGIAVSVNYGVDDEKSLTNFDGCVFGGVAFGG